MKKMIVLCIVLAVALAFGGCAPTPELPAHWQQDWIVISSALAVEPLENYTLSQVNDALGSNGIYLASWVQGEGKPYTNDEEQEVKIYDRQVYVLLQRCYNPGQAQATLNQWVEQEGENFRLGESRKYTADGVEFTLLPLLESSQTNPYKCGTAAFAICGNWVVSVESLSVQASDSETEQALLRMLDGFHFNQ